MLTCALDGYKKKCKCDSHHTSFFFFFNIFIMNKALLYLKQFLKIYNPLALLTCYLHIAGKLEKLTIKVNFRSIKSKEQVLLHKLLLLEMENLSP